MSEQKTEPTWEQAKEIAAQFWYGFSGLLSIALAPLILLFVALVYLWPIWILLGLGSLLAKLYRFF